MAEPAVFAQEEIDAVRDDVIQVFKQNPPNLNQAKSKEATVIALAIIALNDTFEWACNTGPSRSTLTCSSWQLILST